MVVLNLGHVRKYNQTTTRRGTHQRLLLPLPVFLPARENHFLDGLLNTGVAVQEEEDGSTSVLRAGTRRSLF